MEILWRQRVASPVTNNNDTALFTLLLPFLDPLPPALILLVPLDRFPDSSQFFRLRIRRRRYILTSPPLPPPPTTPVDPVFGSSTTDEA